VRQYDQILPKQRHFGALAGPEADVLRLARLDSALELFRASQDAQHLPQHKPAPLTQQKPPEKERSESYYLHLVALEAKLHWYGAIPDSSFGGNLPALADAIVARRRHPVLLNLAAKILADDSVRNFEQARVYVMEALGSAQGQARIRTLNTLAWLWEREGETLPRQEPARKQCCFQEALAALQESQKLDPENTFTGTALERVAARLRGLTG
jgi:tetratricopeptide (TPR) repeat protein